MPLVQARVKANAQDEAGQLFRVGVCCCPGLAAKTLPRSSIMPFQRPHEGLDVLKDVLSRPVNGFENLSKALKDFSKPLQNP